MTVLSILREGEATSWFADWLLSDPPPWLEVQMPPQVSANGHPQIRIEGTVIKKRSRDIDAPAWASRHQVWILTGRKWMQYWEGKWPD